MVKLQTLQLPLHLRVLFPKDMVVGCLKYILLNLRKLFPGDVVLEDCCFNANVKESVAFRGAPLNTPAITKGKPQFAADVESIWKLANV